MLTGGTSGSTTRMSPGSAGGGGLEEGSVKVRAYTLWRPGSTSSSAAQTTRIAPLGRTLTSFSVSSTAGVFVTRNTVLVAITYANRSAGVSGVSLLSKLMTPAEMAGFR